MSKSKTNLVRYILLALMTLIFTVAIPKKVDANSGPPPTVIWFLFKQFEKGEHKQLGVQLVGCVSPNCNSKVLLQSFGQCTDVQCLTTEPVLNHLVSQFTCDQELCYSVAYPNHGGGQFFLIAQYEDKVRVSNSDISLPTSFETVTYQVKVGDETLSIEKSEALPDNATYPKAKNPILLILISITSEILIGFVLVNYVFKLNTKFFSTWLFKLVLANTLSLPIVWLVFPGFTKWVNVSERNLAYLILVGLILLNLWVYILYSTRMKIVLNTNRYRIYKLIMLLLLAFIFLVVIVGSVLITISASYLPDFRLETGLPATSALLISEAVIVVYETVFLYLIVKVHTSFKQLGFIVFLMNVGSFLLYFLVT
ncbi:MAG TPA: hypothetical protein PK299_04480 [Anaerolineales bacterium]|nr:hypothetical protein [Anaerolineales bacterium]